jgi:hypothetical protein
MSAILPAGSLVPTGMEFEIVAAIVANLVLYDGFGGFKRP